MAKQLDLPVGTSPARARALQALAKKGRVRSEKITVRDTGQQRVKLHKDVKDAVTVENMAGDEVQVWPEQEQRYLFVVEREKTFAAFVKERTGRDPAEFKIAAMHMDDPEQYDQDDAEQHAALREAFVNEYPEFDPLMEEEA